MIRFDYATEAMLTDELSEVRAAAGAARWKE
jgi:hypothetical protein